MASIILAHNGIDSALEYVSGLTPAAPDRAIEFLEDGELHVERHDAQQLLEIKRGEWSLERVKEESARLFAIAETTYLESSLPPGPDYDAIDRLCVAVVETAWAGGQFEENFSSPLVSGEG